MSQTEGAIAAIQEGFNCSQAVLSAYGPPLGLDREMALRLSAPFGGGMGRTGNTCGAVTGAFMAIGARHGTIVGGDAAARDRVYNLVREFIAQFKARNGSLLCRDLFGHDWNSLEPDETRALF